MSSLRRFLVSVVALVFAVGGMTAIAQTEPVPTAPLGVWCPQVTSPSLGQAVTCKVVPDPDWVPPTSSTPPTTTTPSSTTTTTPPTTDPPVTTTTTTPPAPAYPNDTNTGVPGTTLLTVHSGDLSITTANAVVDAKNITGSLYVRASGAVIKNSRVAGRVFNRFNNQNYSFTMQDSTVGPSSGCGSFEAIGNGSYTLERVRVRNVVEGPRVSGSNVLIKDSFITTCGENEAHSDGIQGVGGGSNVRIYHNTIDVTGSHPDVTSAVFIADGSSSADVRDNLLAGGGYVLRLHNDPNNAGSNWRASGNRIVYQSWVKNDSWEGGPTFNTNVCNKTGFVWSDNRLVTIGPDKQPTALLGSVSC